MVLTDACTITSPSAVSVDVTMAPTPIHQSSPRGLIFLVHTLICGRQRLKHCRCGEVLSFKTGETEWSPGLFLQTFDYELFVRFVYEERSLQRFEGSGRVRRRDITLKVLRWSLRCFYFTEAFLRQY